MTTPTRATFVAVISNGTAVLGLGNIGALAGKPVMEGKALLFKIFAGLDCYDIEVDEKDPEKFISIVKALGPTFGGINLEDIKAPECFEIETRLKAEMDIPVMHDDQHGTAIISAAGLLNAPRNPGQTHRGRAPRGQRRRRGSRVVHQALHSPSASGKKTSSCVTARE